MLLLEIIDHKERNQIIFQYQKTIVIPRICLIMSLKSNFCFTFIDIGIYLHLKKSNMIKDIKTIVFQKNEK